MEMRKHRRVTVRGEVEGHVVLATEIDVKDISIGGALFESTRRFNPGSRCMISITHRKGKLNLNGRVVRAVLVRTRREGGDIIPVYAAAVQFLPMDEQMKEALEELIGSLADEGTERETE